MNVSTSRPTIIGLFLWYYVLTLHSIIIPSIGVVQAFVNIKSSSMVKRRMNNEAVITSLHAAPKRLADNVDGVVYVNEKVSGKKCPPC